MFGPDYLRELRRYQIHIELVVSSPTRRRIESRDVLQNKAIVFAVNDLSRANVMQRKYANCVLN
jgi:hypothetical protein